MRVLLASEEPLLVPLVVLRLWLRLLHQVASLEQRRHFEVLLPGQCRQSFCDLQGVLRRAPAALHLHGLHRLRATDETILHNALPVHHSHSSSCVSNGKIIIRSNQIHLHVFLL
mmetsp:Transcript_8832/g.16898  ORF Transcript_8832/g.16898 Transcript_8832/m.16898 type:complete len:114 (+) Transcript_8832:1291-1632(+)